MFGIRLLYAFPQNLWKCGRVLGHSFDPHPLSCPQPRLQAQELELRSLHTIEPFWNFKLIKIERKLFKLFLFNQFSPLS